MKCICEFPIPVENTEHREFALSSVDKLSYIIGALNRQGIQMQVISASRTKSRKGYYPGREDPADDKNTVVSGPTFGASNGLTRALQKAFSLLWLFWYLLMNTKKDEKVYVYHEVFVAPIILLIKKLKKIQLILEVEEIFYDLQGDHVSNWRIWLEDQVVAAADAYVFASKQLERRCNQQGKPYAIANGRYIAEKKKTSPPEDGKIHLVYAGLIEEGKVAFNTVDIARYLPENYLIHIIGYGNEADIESLCCRIEQVNRDSACQVRYDGLKRGEDYIRYLQSCHVGLCPLLGDARFQNACFPSKITSYLSNGIHVITTENEVVRTSAYAELISFSRDSSPEQFAKAIQNMSLEATDPRMTIQQMDREFCEELRKVIGEGEQS